MTLPSLMLTHLTFVGPKREAAHIDFQAGLNVIYGASETGKSFIAESIDFVLGASDKLSDIKEREGYDRVFLGLRVSDQSTFTLERAVVGGKIKAHNGKVTSAPSVAPLQILAPKHNPNNSANISSFLLEKISLLGKRIRKNASGATNSLSFRNLSHLCIVSQTEMQQKRSPIETGQAVSKTAELSTFKLLLTGVDDSALQGEIIPDDEKLSRSAKAEVLDELIANYHQRIATLVGEGSNPDTLRGELSEVDEVMTRERQALDSTEGEYQSLRSNRTEVRNTLDVTEERSAEISELLERFRLLDIHYSSDLARLEALQEAGTLTLALTSSACPLCGASPEAQHLSGDCDGNVETVVAAADAENQKVMRLKTELGLTVAELKTEAVNLEVATPRLKQELSEIEAKLAEVNPAMKERQAQFSAILEKRSVLSTALGYHLSILEFEERKSALEGDESISKSTEKIEVGLSANIQQDFADEVGSVLTAWHFPQTLPVHFDMITRDVVLAGKERGSFGAGMRALTHAAFNISLLQFTRKNELPHPGFVVLDTPLLAYREPEGKEDDLSGTDVKDRFYEFLAAYEDRQVIVLENMNPPQSVIDAKKATFFTKNPHSGRYGFFPLKAGTA